MNARLITFVAATVLAAPASAWDSTCVKYGNTVYGPGDAAKRICAGSDATTACSTAQDEARGLRVGEHALLASRGLGAARRLTEPACHEHEQRAPRESQAEASA